MEEDIKLFPQYSEFSSNTVYGHSYEDILVDNSLLFIPGLKLINDPEIYQEKGRIFMGLKIISFLSETFISTPEMIQNVINKKKEGDFIILPANNAESDIVIEKKTYKIKYSNKKLNLSQCQKNQTLTSSNLYEPYNELFIIPKKKSNVKIYDKYYKYTYNLDINLLNRYQGEYDQKDKIVAVAIFMKHILFFYKSKCENDGFFYVNEGFNINIYNSNILSSFDSEANAELTFIKAKSFLVYETKSTNFKELKEKAKFRANFIKHFLEFYHKKYDIENGCSYIGFFRSNKKVQISQNDVETLKKSNINFAFIQNDNNTIFGKNILFQKIELNKINEIALKMQNVEKNTISMEKKMTSVEQNIRNDINLMNTRISSVEQNIDLANTRITSIEKNIDLANTRITSVEQNINLANTRIASVEQNINLMNMRISSVEQNINLANTRIASVEQNINLSNTRIASVEQNIRNDINLINSRITSVEQNIRSDLNILNNNINYIMNYIGTLVNNNDNNKANEKQEPDNSHQDNNKENNNEINGCGNIEKEINNNDANKEKEISKINNSCQSITNQVNNNKINDDDKTKNLIKSDDGNQAKGALKICDINNQVNHNIIIGYDKTNLNSNIGLIGQCNNKSIDDNFGKIHSNMEICEEDKNKTIIKNDFK